MKVTTLDIPDVLLLEPTVFKDGRGFFLEVFNREVFKKNGIDVTFVQDNMSRSTKGVLRGLHWQEAPRAQAKLVRVLKGEVFDVAVDIRKDSRTFGKHVAVHLNQENNKMIYIPPGFAHGFCVLTDAAEFFYKVSDFYSPEHERGLLWDDPDLNISWPSLDVPYILSERDRHHPCLKNLQQL